MLLNEIEDSGLASWTECHGKDTDETPYAPFRIEVEVTLADRTDGVV